MADLPAHVLHEHKEVAQVVGVLDGRPQVRLQHGTEGGLALALPQPFDVADGLGGSALHDNRQAVLPAETVRGGTELLVIGLGIAVVFSAGIRIDGIENQVGVDMLFVNMNRNHRFKARQVFPGKFRGNLQRQLRRDLTRFEGLNHILDGAKGEKGDSGKGIIDIVKTGSAGNVDTYTINFTDGTSTTFTVSNGRENEKTSQLENDSGFITKFVTDLANYYTKNETLSTTEITALIEQKANGERVIVEGTDAGKPNVNPENINPANTYLVKTTNGYSMWAWISNDWARLGDTDINLSGYYTMGQVDAKFATKTELELYAKDADLAPVAKSGSYNDLADKPTIPNMDGFATAAQIDSKVQEAQKATEAKIPDVSGFRKKTDAIQYSEISGTPVVDTALSATSTNAVQNKIVTEAVNAKVSEIKWDGKDIDNPETFLQALKLYVGRVHNPETLESVAPAPFGQSSYILFSEHSSRSYAMQFAFSDHYGLLFAARAKHGGKWYPWTYLNDMSKFDPSALTAAQVTALKAKLGLS